MRVGSAFWAKTTPYRHSVTTALPTVTGILHIRHSYTLVSSQMRHSLSQMIRLCVVVMSCDREKFNSVTAYKQRINITNLGEAPEYQRRL